MFENLVNCLLRSPGSLFIPFMRPSLCVVSFSFQFVFGLSIFSFVVNSVLHGRPGWLLSKFREMYLAHHPQALCSIAPLLSSTVGSIVTLPLSPVLLVFSDLPTVLSSEYLFALWLVRLC